MAHKLTRDLSYSELMTMRESGMTNQEIADSLDTSYKSVLAVIGKQPKDLRKKPEFHVDQPRPTFGSEPVVEPAACLVVANRQIELAGLFGSYTIPIQNKVVSVTIPDQGSVHIPFEQLDEFICELQAIQRKLPSLTNTAEMW